MWALLVQLTLCLHSATGKSVYIGCYADKVRVSERALPLGMIIDKKSMTVDKCIAGCDEHGFPFAGLEYGEECWCGNKEPRWSRLPNEKCEMTCTGNTGIIFKDKCGGPLALSVYRNTLHPLPLPVADHIKAAVADRPLLALVMILKDEAHTIAKTLNTVKGCVDRYYVLDTGSTDGTQQRVRDEMAGVPGGVWEEPFKDYGTTRNRVLELANGTHPAPLHQKPLFTLMLSADEQVRNCAELRTHLRSYLFSFGPCHQAYPVVMNSGIEFDSVRVARVDDGWRYVGRVHEYLAAPDKSFYDLFRPTPNIHVQFAATDHTRRFHSQYTIIGILEDEVSKNPNDTRSWFYLGRTYETVNQLDKSLRAYTTLAKVSKWNEEVYDGLLNAAIIAHKMDKPWHLVLQMFLDAYAKEPKKIDALYWLANHYHSLGKESYALAYLYAFRGFQLEIPESVTVVQNVLLRDTRSMYEWQNNRLLCDLALDLKEYAVCVAACDALLKHRPTDSMVRGWRDKCFSLLPPPSPPALHHSEHGDSTGGSLFSFNFAHVLMGVDEDNPSGIDYSKYGLSGTLAEELSLPPSTMRKLRIANRETRTMLLLLLLTCPLMGVCWYYFQCRPGTKSSRMTQ